MGEDTLNYGSMDELLDKFDADFDTLIDDSVDELSEPTPEANVEPEGSKETIEPTEPTEHTEPTKPTESKSQIDFRGLREENQRKERVIQENDQFMKRLAQASGFATVTEWQQAINESLAQKEAEKAGIPVEVYNRLTEQEEAINQLTNHQQSEQLKLKAQALSNSVDGLVATYNLSESDKSEMFATLEGQGYTLDTLLSLPNPELIFRGAIADKIASNKAQQAVQGEVSRTERMANLDTEDLQGSATPTESLADEVDADLKAYYSSIGKSY